MKLGNPVHFPTSHLHLFLYLYNLSILYNNSSMPVTKRGLQNVGVNFYCTADLKAQTIKALEKEGKGLSEFLRFAMYEKVKEHKKV